MVLGIRIRGIGGPRGIELGDVSISMAMDLYVYGTGSGYGVCFWLFG